MIKAASGEKIVPYAIRAMDYHNFGQYINSLEVKDSSGDLVPSSTFFCLDTDRNVIVGAFNIRHDLHEGLLLNGGILEMASVLLNQGKGSPLP